jgi:hypothetical protein
LPELRQRQGPAQRNAFAVDAASRIARNALPFGLYDSRSRAALVRRRSAWFVTLSAARLHDLAALTGFMQSPPRVPGGRLSPLPSSCYARHMKARSRRATIQEVLDGAIELERKTMALYTALLRIFRNVDELRGFWFSMARHEAGHCGALTLVKSLLENDPSLVGNRKVWFDDVTVTRLRSLLAAYRKEVRRGVDIERALAMALDIESSELEDVVVDLLQVVKDRRWRDQAVQMLIHDLGDLSFMIEKYTTDEALLARADELVERRLGGLRRTTGERLGPVGAGTTPARKAPARAKTRTAGSRTATLRGSRTGAASADRHRRR